MDVDDAARVLGAQVGRQHLHVARQHHAVAVHFFEDALHFGVRSFLVVRHDRHMMERDAVPLDKAAEGVVVGDDARNLDVEFLGLPACQQVVKAVLLLRNQQHQTLLHRRIVDLPVHLQRLTNGDTEALAELGEQERNRVGLDLDAHEVAAGQVVGVIARLEDPATMLGDEAGGAGDDANLVGAGGGERVEAFAVHGDWVSRPWQKPCRSRYGVRHTIWSPDTAGIHG